MTKKKQLKKKINWNDLFRYHAVSQKLFCELSIKMFFRNVLFYFVEKKFCDFVLFNFPKKNDSLLWIVKIRVLKYNFCSIGLSPKYISRKLDFPNRIFLNFQVTWFLVSFIREQLYFIVVLHWSVSSRKIYNSYNLQVLLEYCKDREKPYPCELINLILRISYH